MCLLCSSGDGLKRGYLAADGFGSEFCYLEAEAREEVSRPIYSATEHCCAARLLHAHCRKHASYGSVLFNWRRLSLYTP